MSDTPRTDSAYGIYELQKTAYDLEIKLNAAQQRIKQLEEMYEGEPGERPDLLGSNVMGLLKRELIGTQKRIKELEEENDAMRADLLLWSKQEVRA